MEFLKSWLNLSGNMVKDTVFSIKNTLNCRGVILDLSIPRVMGILNITPDSFYDGGKYLSEKQVIEQAQKMKEEGAAIIDIGGVSTRPGAGNITEKEETERLIPVIKSIVKEFSGFIISVDTFRSAVAEKAVDAGAHMINDVSGGAMDDRIFSTAAKLKVPYVLMHMKGTPEIMQQDPHYENVVMEVLDFFRTRVEILTALGVKDIVLDPGFGFGKNTEHNYRLLKNLSAFQMLNLPVLAGVSRKSMINRVLDTRPETALNGTTSVNTLALMNGANILRVHDVREAAEAIKIVEYYRGIEKGNTETGY